MTIAPEDPARLNEVDLTTRRRAEILTGSIRVIARDGVVAAKLKDIARESGVSLGLIQHYFDTRENLVDATFEVMMRVISRESALRVRTIEDPLQFIYALNSQHVFGSVAFPERWGFWSELWSGSGRSGPLRTVASQVYELWARPLEEALGQLAESHRLPASADPHRLTAGILALMDGLSIRTLADPDVVSPEFMLEVLNDWVTVQLGVDPAEARLHLTELERHRDAMQPRALTPEVVAEALLEGPAT
ncbi:TetR/AcrR family transcriptional regulator [Leucobacter luti]|uniref:TetR family transcriptional regulator n=1 Tax=Leucobacter luti TaxID=340320 RepID=A0A4Q7TQ10_9MICO|nr:TetR family transcriptional regulator C-terminal domain-containing protein [Leucobacter luti]RZT62854.1 TetR family transcriptional regulator [Leucobacter luti]